MISQGNNSPIQINLKGIAIHLHEYGNIAQFINPLTLIYNGIVDSSWEHGQDIQVGLDESHISYANGVSIDSFEEDLSFEHIVLHEKDMPILSPEIALRYVETLGISNCNELSMEFIGNISYLDGKSVAIDIWSSLLNGFITNQTKPVFALLTSYVLQDKSIKLEMRFNLDDSTCNLICVGTVKRRLPETIEDAEAMMKLVLTEWNNDWQDIIAGYTQLLSENLFKGCIK